MKFLKKLIFHLTLLVVVGTIVSSCGTSADVASNGLIQKRKHRQGWHINTMSSSQKGLENHKQINEDSGISAILKESSLEAYKDLLQQTSYTASTSQSGISDKFIERPMRSIARAAVNHMSNGHRANDYEQSECDEIILRDGSIISAKVTEIGVSEIKYKKCDNESGPVYSVLKSEVFMVKYPNGSTDVFGTPNSTATQTQSETKTSLAPFENDNPSPPGTDPLALFSVLFALAGLLIGLALSVGVGFLFGVVAIIFGAVSLNRIEKYPEKYGGKGAATFGLVSGILVSLLMLGIWAVVVALII